MSISRCSSVDELGPNGAPIAYPSPRFLRYCGLKNREGTDWLNVCIQLLYLGNKSRAIVMHQARTSGPIGRALGQIFQRFGESRVWQCPDDNGYYFPFTGPWKFHKLCMQNVIFVKQPPIDAQHFYRALIEKLHDETKQGGESAYSRLMQGQYECKTVCSGCKAENGGRINFWHLLYDPSLSLRRPDEAERPIALADCMQELQVRDKMTLDARDCNCEAPRIVKRNTVKRSPNYLVIFIRRYMEANMKFKVDRLVTISPQIVFNNRRYAFTAAVLHEEASGGQPAHFSALYFEDNNRWVMLDDESITVCVDNESAMSMLEGYAYIVLYRAVK